MKKQKKPEYDLIRVQDQTIFTATEQLTLKHTDTMTYESLQTTVFASTWSRPHSFNT